MQNEYVEDRRSLPLVSIIIMNYNYASFLPVAIESCLKQTYPRVETIVVDDGSTDRSVQVIEGYGDRIISVLKPNGGQASALNAGFSASSGDIICLLDADDVFLPEKAAYVVEQFQSNPKFVWFFTESSPVETNKIELDGIDCLFSEVRGKNTSDHLTDFEFREDIIRGKIPDFTPSTSNLCFSRSLFEKLMPLPEIKGISGVAISDLYIKTLAVALGVGRVSKRELGLYRFHNNYYTNLNLDKKRWVFGEINVSTGYWINKNFPEFNRIGRKFLAKGYATYLSSRYIENQATDADCDRMLQEFLAQSSWSKRIETQALITYYRFRLRFKNFV